jgi:predicted protein tyrosine phosphatase
MTKHLDNPFQHLMGNMNQIANVHNRYQMSAPRVLFLCSAGLLRSPTAAAIFASPPYNWNTRAAGVSAEYALIPATLPLLMWADRVFMMEEDHMVGLKRIFSTRLDRLVKEKDAGEDFFTVLDIPDQFEYRSEELVDLLRTKIDAINPFPTTTE